MVFHQAMVVRKIRGNSQLGYLNRVHGLGRWLRCGCRLCARRGRRKRCRRGARADSSSALGHSVGPPLVSRSVMAWRGRAGEQPDQIVESDRASARDATPGELLKTHSAAVVSRAGCGRRRGGLVRGSHVAIGHSQERGLAAFLAARSSELHKVIEGRAARVGFGAVALRLEFARRVRPALAAHALHLQTRLPAQAHGRPPSLRAIHRESFASVLAA